MSNLLVGEQVLRNAIASNPQKYGAIKSALDQGVKTVRQGMHYFGRKVAVNSDLGGGSTINLIRTEDVKKEGVRSIDKGKVPAGSIFVAVGFMLEYATLSASSGKDADEVLFSNKIYNPQDTNFVEAETTGGTEYALSVAKQRIPTKVLNSEITLKRGNNTYFFGLFQDCCKENSIDQVIGTGLNNASGVTFLPSPIIFDDEASLKAEILLPVNGAAGTADHFFRIRWYGFEVADI